MVWGGQGEEILEWDVVEYDNPDSATGKSVGLVMQVCSPVVSFATARLSRDGISPLPLLTCVPPSSTMGCMPSDLCEQ